MREQFGAEQLRAQLRGMGERGRGRRYPAGVREQVVSYVAARRAEGISLRVAAQELGMPWRTVRHWVQGRGRRGAALRTLAIAATPGASTVVVHGPHGLRIEGLDLDQIAELLLRLGGSARGGSCAYSPTPRPATCARTTTRWPSAVPAPEVPCTGQSPRSFACISGGYRSKHCASTSTGRTRPGPR
jgi:transposase